MKTIITTLGRGHFVQAVDSLRRAGIDADIAQGWVPKEVDESWTLRFIAKLLGRNHNSFLYGFKHRSTKILEGHNFSDFWSEAIQSLLLQIFSRVINSRTLWHWGMKVGFWMHGSHVARIIRKGHYDILHVRSGFGRFAIAAARRRKCKVLVDHSAGAPQYIIEDVEGRTWDSKTYWWTVMQDCVEADLLMVNSEFVKQTFISYGYPAEKIRVVYLGQEAWFNGLKEWNDFELNGIGRIPEKPLRLVFTGAFAAHKGSEEFLQAVAKLIVRRVYFTVAVLGALNITVEQRKKYAEAISKIKFYGHVAQDEMVKVMKQQHVYLFPSYSEGCARSAMEAMSMGLCVVCTRESGVPINDGEDGFIIKKRNSDSIVKAILWLIDHPEEISKAGFRAAQKLKKFTWKDYACNVKKVYSELLKAQDEKQK